MARCPVHDLGVEDMPRRQHLRVGGIQRDVPVPRRVVARLDVPARLVHGDADEVDRLHLVVGECRGVPPASARYSSVYLPSCPPGHARGSPAPRARGRAPRGTSRLPLPPVPAGPPRARASERRPSSSLSRPKLSPRITWHGPVRRLGANERHGYRTRTQRSLSQSRASTVTLPTGQLVPAFGTGPRPS